MQRNVVERELHGALMVDAKLGLHHLTSLLILLVFAPNLVLLQQIFNLAISAQQCTALYILDQLVKIFLATAGYGLGELVPAHLFVDEIDGICEHFFLAVHLGGIFGVFGCAAGLFPPQPCSIRGKLHLLSL